MRRVITVQFAVSVQRANRIHTHPCWEIVFYSKGRGTALIGTEERPFMKNDLFCFPPGTPHGERAEHNYESYWILFEDTAAPSGAIIFRDPAHHPCLRLIELMHHEYLLDSRNREMSAALLDPLMQIIMRHAGPARGHVIEAMKHILISNVRNPDFQLNTALEAFDRPYISLHLQFTKAVGITPMQYLIDLRIRESRMLLERPEITVREVALQTGFRDPYYFSRIFSKKTGMSPLAFRRKYSGQSRPKNAKST
ncbi:MAG: helix-turn-helix domain-containing protein [Spirochaetes bacterium]|nr:helix-turn-helix domain-containing protein [Spirochaetota bacterium]